MKTHRLPVLLLLLLLAPARTQGVVSDEGDALPVSGDHADVIYRTSYRR